MSSCTSTCFSEPAPGATAAAPGGSREGRRQGKRAHRVQGERVQEDRGRCHRAGLATHRQEPWCHSTHNSVPFFAIKSEMWIKFRTLILRHCASPQPFISKNQEALNALLLKIENTHTHSKLKLTINAF